MKPFSHYTDEERTAIVWAAAVSWDIPTERRVQLRAAFYLVNPLIINERFMPTMQAEQIRELVAWQNLERHGPLRLS